MGKTIKILFVDDEQNVIDGLRSLRGMSDKWDMAFAISAKEALQILETDPYDAIVSDMRMPVMDGPELLSEVSERFPQMVRFALSGHSDEEMILRSVVPTHQYISKPCNVDELKTIVIRACTLKQLLESDTLQQLVSRTESIPSLPSLYLEINKEIESSSGSMISVGNIISRDMGMSAKILQIVNSAFFGLRQRISDPSQAAMFLGLNTIKALVLSIHVFAQIDPELLSKFKLASLWNHSMNTAANAKAISAMEDADREMVDNCFTSGLLHDIGKLLLVSNHPEQYSRVIELVESKAMCLVNAEKEVFGGTHAELGGYLLGIWGLDDAIVEAVCFHHAPLLSPCIKFSPLTSVHVGDGIEHEVDQPRMLSPESIINADYLTKIGLIHRLPDWIGCCQEIDKEGAGNE